MLHALGVSERREPRLRRHDERALYRARNAVVVEEGNQRLAFAHFGQRLHGVERRIGAEGARRRFDVFQGVGAEGAQCVLDAVAELVKHRFRQVARVLADEIDADTFRADEAHGVFDAFQEARARGF